MRNYLPGIVEETLAIGTLAAKTLVKGDFDNGVVEKTFISSIEAIYSLREVSQAANVGPLLVGIAHSDYTATEIEAFIENSGSWNQGDKISQEISNRLIRQIGVFDQTGTATGADVLNEGRPIKTKLGWTLITGQKLTQWAYNLGSQPYATTDPQFHMNGKANLWTSL